MDTTSDYDDAAQRDAKDAIHAKSISAMKAKANTKANISQRVPVHVETNDARAVNALPPPISQPVVRGGNERQKKSRKKTGGIGDGIEDSGSDSDGRKGSTDSSRQALGMLKPQSLPGNTALYPINEGWRIQALKARRLSEEEWRERLRYRDQKRTEGEQLRKLWAQDEGRVIPTAEFVDQVCKQQKALIEYLDESLLSVPLGEMLEFFMASDSAVWMALLKNGRAKALKMVPNEDLDQIGWRRSDGGDYWRYTIFNDHPDLVFRVNMDGEVLELVDHA